MEGERNFVGMLEKYRTLWCGAEEGQGARGC